MDNPGFEIDGDRYPIPTLDTFDLDEEEILYTVAGVVLEDFALPHPEADPEERAAHVAEFDRKIESPRFKRALAHIAYRRRHPDVQFDLAQTMAGKVNSLEITIAFIRGDVEDPTETSPTPPASSTDTSEPSKDEASGTATENGSGAPVAQLASIGRGR